MGPGRERDESVVKRLGGMEEGMEKRRERERSKSTGKRPLDSPTRPSSKPHTSKVQRMDQDRPASNLEAGDNGGGASSSPGPSETLEAADIQVEKKEASLKEDENQNKLPNRKVGSSRSNGC